jgi:lantibiotic modifying enzyme
MAKHMMDAGRGGERARALAERVRRSVRGLPLNPYDHLCCGNAAVAEYHLTMGDREAAGRVLDALYGRRLREGEYRDAHSATSGQVSASLFDGISGIGYEMLRYARPHDVPSILGGSRDDALTIA